MTNISCPWKPTINRISSVSSCLQREPVGDCVCQLLWSKAPPAKDHLHGLSADVNWHLHHCPASLHHRPVSMEAGRPLFLLSPRHRFPELWRDTLILLNTSQTGEGLSGHVFSLLCDLICLQVCVCIRPMNVAMKAKYGFMWISESAKPPNRANVVCAAMSLKRRYAGRSTPPTARLPAQRVQPPLWPKTASCPACPTQVRSHVHTHTHTHNHIYTHTTHTQSYTHTHTHTNTHTHSYTHIHTCTLTNSHKQMRCIKINGQL